MTLASQHYATKTKTRTGRPNHLFVVQHLTGLVAPCIVPAPSAPLARTKVSRFYGNGRIALYAAFIVHGNEVVPDVIDGPVRVKCVPAGYIETI